MVFFLTGWFVQRLYREARSLQLQLLLNQLIPLYQAGRVIGGPVRSGSAFAGSG